MYNLIKKYRLLRNMTQKQLGNAVGVSDVAIRQYELFKRKAKDPLLKKIANALNIKFEYLKEPRYPYTSEDIINILIKFEEHSNIQLFETQNSICIKIDNEIISDKLRSWNELKNKLYNKEITQDEYDLEKANI